MITSQLYWKEVAAVEAARRAREKRAIFNELFQVLGILAYLASCVAWATGGHL